MNQNTDEPMLRHDQVKLLLPQVERIISQDVEESVILGACHWNLNHLADEIGHYRATSATLRIEMRYVWNRHVVSKVQHIVPISIAIQCSRSESRSTELTPILVDTCGPPPELIVFCKQAPVVIQIMDVYLKAAI